MRSSARATPSVPNCCPVSRSAWSRLARLALAAALALLANDARPAAATPQGETPFSVQMHLHGSMSEGTASMESHTHEARDAGVDVLWWTDHDWRMTYYHHSSTFSFDDFGEPLSKGEKWQPRQPQDRDGFKFVKSHEPSADGRIEIDGSDPWEGSGCMNLWTSSPGPDYTPYSVSLRSSRDRFTRSLASDLTLAIAIRPTLLEGDSRAGLLVMLSYHPDGAGDPSGARYAVRYELDDGGGEPYRDGDEYVVPLSFVEDEWNLYSLQLSDDARRGFSDALGPDNAAVRIELRLETRNGNAAEACFDDFRLLHAAAGDALLAHQRTLLDELERQVPEVIQLQGTEISYENPHLNEFAGDLLLHDYDELAELSGQLDDNGWITDRVAYREFVAQYVVDDSHRRGGLVSLNHPFGTSNRNRKIFEEVIDEVVSGELDIDLLEVGYRRRGDLSLATHLDLWDELARRGRFIVGIGVSDHHHGGPGQGWDEFINNFVTWIYATEPTEAALLDSLRAGRAFFGDIFLFDGTVDLVTDEGHRMGEVVATERSEVPVTVTIEGLTAGDEVRIVEQGRVARTLVADAASFELEHPVDLSEGFGSMIRVEVYDATGEAKVFSNPIWFSRPEAGAERLAPAPAEEANRP